MHFSRACTQNRARLPVCLSFCHFQFDLNVLWAKGRTHTHTPVFDRPTNQRTDRVPAHPWLRCRFWLHYMLQMFTAISISIALMTNRLKPKSFHNSSKSALCILVFQLLSIYLLFVAAFILSWAELWIMQLLWYLPPQANIGKLTYKGYRRCKQCHRK